MRILLLPLFHNGRDVKTWGQTSFNRVNIGLGVQNLSRTGCIYIYKYLIVLAWEAFAAFHKLEVQKLFQHPSFIDFWEVLITFEFVIIHAQPRGKNMSQFPNKIATAFATSLSMWSAQDFAFSPCQWIVSDPVILSYYTYKCSSFTGSTWIKIADIPVNSCFRIHVHSENPCFLLVPKVGNIRNIFPFRELEIHIGLFTSDQAVNIPIEAPVLYLQRNSWTRMILHHATYMLFMNVCIQCICFIFNVYTYMYT